MLFLQDENRQPTKKNIKKCTASILRQMIVGLSATMSWRPFMTSVSRKEDSLR